MIKYLVMDVDGTLTDGKIYIGSKGEVMKAFSVKDGYAINYILRPNNIVPIVITARKSDIVLQRCKELGITEVHQGISNKLSVLTDIVGKENLGYCAYFGDDVLDKKCMIPIKEAGGIIGCPSDSVQEVKAISDYVCFQNAGYGALREFSEWLIKFSIKNNSLKNRVQDAVDYILNLSDKQLISGRCGVNENFYYYVHKYKTKPVEMCKLESHRKYVEVQFILEGEEKIGIVDTLRLSASEEYDEDEDIMFWNMPDYMAQSTLKENDYIIIYPEYAHICTMMNKQCSNVKKIVGKIKI